MCGEPSLLPGEGYIQGCDSELCCKIEGEHEEKKQGQRVERLLKGYLRKREQKGLLASGNHELS